MAIRRQPWGPEMTEEDYLLQAQQNRSQDPLASYGGDPVIGSTTKPPSTPTQDFPLPPGPIQDVPPPPPAVPPGPSNFGGGDPNQQKRQIADARGGAAPLGFQQNKWSNQEWNTNKYRGGTILAGGGGIQDVLADPMFKDWSQVDEDEIKSPTGNVYDLFYDYGGPNQRVQWTQTGWGDKSDPRLRDNVRGNFAAQEHPNRNAPASSSLGDWDQFLGGLGPGGQPMGQGAGMGGNVGQDPFSQLLTGGLGNLIARGGANQFGQDVNATLADVINDAAMGPNQGRMNARLETLRENAGLAQRSMINDARGSLASRGLLSEPGTPQGPEISAITRISESLAIPFAQGLRDAQVEESQFADQRLMQGLGLAADQSQAQSSNLLGALGEGTNRQNVLAQIALGALDRNIVWNQFLAEYGLDRERLANEIQQGRIQNVQQIMELFARYVEMARQGQVGS